MHILSITDVEITLLWNTLVAASIQGKDAPTMAKLLQKIQDAAKSPVDKFDEVTPVEIK